MNITRTEQDKWIEQEMREKSEKEYLLKKQPDPDCDFCENCKLMFNPDNIEHFLICEISEEEITKNYKCPEEGL